MYIYVLLFPVSAEYKISVIHLLFLFVYTFNLDTI